jgi:hypothetical protein
MRSGAPSPHQYMANSQRQLGVFMDFFYIRCASPTSGVQITGPIVLLKGQLKGNERIHKALTPNRRASPTVIEITC